MRNFVICFMALVSFWLLPSAGLCSSMNQAQAAGQENTVVMSREDFNELKLTLTEAKGALKEAKSQLAESRMQLERAQSQLQEQSREIVMLKTQLTAASGSLTNAKESLRSTKSDIDELERQHIKTENNLRHQRQAWQIATVAAVLVGVSF